MSRGARWATVHLYRFAKSQIQLKQVFKGGGGETEMRITLFLLLLLLVLTT